VSKTFIAPATCMGRHNAGTGNRTSNHAVNCNTGTRRMGKVFLPHTC
jgi:hypothetical protein